MSEIEPRFSPSLADKRDELARLEALVAKQQVEVNGSEAFGQDDTTVPNEGEDTYQTYSEQRPSGEQTDVSSSTAAEYYDKVNNIEENSAIERPRLEDLSFMELAKAASKANLIGDRAGVEEVRAIAEHNIMELATREGSDWSDKDFHDEMARFDSVVEKFSAGPVASKVEDLPADELLLEAHTETSAEDDIKAVMHEAVTISPTPEASARTLAPNLVSPSDIPDGRLESIAVPLPEVVPVEAPEIEESAEKGSRIERLKGWWGKNKESIKEKFDLNYWGAKWFVANDRILSRGTTAEMSSEEEQKLRERNRAILLIGAGVLVLTAVAAWGGLGEGDPSLVPTPSAEAPDPAVVDALTPDASDLATEAPIPEVIPVDPNFNIPDGGGGEQLFNALDIDSSTWYNNELDLLNNHNQGGDFYWDSAQGHVGLARPGQLSQFGQDAINALR